ncbi:LysR substrate-binding domain-containing protein [Burkholderia sp. S171]|uniref:LysR substrate-binding domain-containing protein n=1 Tax=Burkholderia sp. S171 TaxID=1641860 RepID=UPI00349E4C59
MAITAAGIALLPDFSVIDDIESGRLAPVLPDWAMNPAPIHALLSTGNFMVPKSQMFIGMLTKYMVLVREKRAKTGCSAAVVVPHASRNSA